jgi:uncharacterized protein (DUF433 family)
MGESLLDRITLNSDQCGGRACIRGMRIRVTDVLGMLAEGVSEKEILEDYPYLEPEDILGVPSVRGSCNGSRGADGGMRLLVDAQLPPALARWFVSKDTTRYTFSISNSIAHPQPPR